jgi:cytochrome o ubiquinol oxidase operon protein cyoD
MNDTVQRQDSFKWYAIGYILCLFLTIGAYFIVETQALMNGVLFSILVSLGVLQAGIQLIFFLHLGRESSPRWNLLAFSFMALVIVIVVFGSLWIMYNLNERVMPPMDIHAHSLRQEGF